MYKKYTLFAILVCLSMAAVLLDYYYEYQTSQQHNSSNSSFVLKSEDDILTLYQGGRLIKRYDIDTTILPLTDQDNLKSGIILEDMSAVTTLLEDFDCY